MTDKRFQQINLPSDVIDTKSGKIYHTLSGNDGYGLCNLLNELHEENQLVKDTLNELKSIDVFWDSALLQGYISKIANILGVDLE